MARKKQTTTTAVEKKETAKMSDNDTILELDMNLADYDDFEPLPNGAYPAQILEAEMRTSDKGNDYYYVIFLIHPDDYPADYAVENNPEGTRLVHARVQKPDPKNRRSITAVKNFMRAIGLDLKTSTIDPSTWVTKKAKLVIKRDEFNGSPTNSIVSIESLD